MLADLPTAPWFRRVLVAALILGIVLLTFSVLQPFVVPLIWGGILAYVSWPLQQRIVRALRGRNGLASLLTTLLVTLAIVVPLVWLILMVRVEAVAAYAQSADVPRFEADVAAGAARSAVDRRMGTGHAAAVVGRPHGD